MPAVDDIGEDAGRPVTGADDEFPELLRQFYDRIFPAKKFYRWLSYGNVDKDYFCNREFSFTLKDDIYIRYLSFADHVEFKQELKKRAPYKIDIGAKYNVKPKNHKTIKSTEFVPQERELVFDIDMTDYDEVRTCCTGADICGKCWPFMTAALEVVDGALRGDFGFKHLLWVYSGRRGIHCWVCDKNARTLNAEGRAAIAEYLTVVRGGDGKAKKSMFYGNEIHPSLQRASNILHDHFDSVIVRDQGHFDTPERWEKVLQLVGDEELKARLKDTFASCHSGEERWQLLRREVDDTKIKSLRFCEEEIVFQHMYPRLDVNVSKGLNHLLKSPFCVHPKTGRVCVPLDVQNIRSFDPFAVPTVTDLLNELDSASADVAESTMMKPRPSLSVWNKRPSALQWTSSTALYAALRSLYVRSASSISKESTR
eukprot:Opistho-2@35874